MRKQTSKPTGTTYSSWAPTRWSRGSPRWPIPTVPALTLHPPCTLLQQSCALLRLTQRRCGDAICHRWVPGTSTALLCSPISCPSSGAASGSLWLCIPFPAGILTDVHGRMSRRSSGPHSMTACRCRLCANRREHRVQEAPPPPSQSARTRQGGS